jgi:DNA-binding transcriptional LysR family regulator
MSDLWRHYFIAWSTMTIPSSVPPIRRAERGILIVRGLDAMFPNIEVRYLQAAVVLAEEMNFTRGSHRLHISQPALSKQITELEERYGLHLFTREKGRLIELTDAGQVFVTEATAALLHAERAIQLARGTQEGCDRVLMIGHSPDTDQSWISTVLTIRLPLYPRLRIRLMGQFPIELVRSVVAGELDLALVTAPTLDADITAVPFDQTPLYAALPENHPAAGVEQLALRDLAEDEWILFPKRLHPIIHDAIMRAARRERITPKYTHDAVTAEQALQLVSEHVGVGLVTKPTAHALQAKGVVLKPFSDKSLLFEICVIMRRTDDSKLTNQFVRSFLRKHNHSSRSATQLELSLSA